LTLAVRGQKAFVCPGRSSGILDLVEAQDLTKYHSSIAKAVLHFPRLVPKDHLDFFGR